MSQRSSSARTARVRPLRPYEPAPAQSASRPASQRRRDDQLTLPLRGEGVPPLPWFTAGGAHQRPCDAELIQLVTALVELAAGMRPPHALRDRVSEPLRQRLLTEPQPWLGRNFLVNRVHCDREGAHVLHVNATVHERSRRAAFATSSSLTPLCWGGWQVREFCLLTPALLARTPNAA
ncbi:MAG: hypothetical protein GEV04_09305 [Actinophytocola sp.]|nr:hypothetical protein [Actinophytocola sp.]